MKIDLKAQNPLEWLALKSGFIPKPVLLAHFGFLTTKVISEALKSGVIDAIAAKKQTPEAIAHYKGLDATAVENLLQALVGLEIVKRRNGSYLLTPATKRWLLPTSKNTYAAQLLFDSEVCYTWLNDLPKYLQTGKGLAYHQTLQPKEWQLYQNAMQSTSGMMSELAARKIIVPSGATHMLDIGGAHGLYSAALLRKHTLLTAEVLDLPEAIAANANKPNAYPDRLHFTAGDVFTFTLPTDTYDIVILANVAHHFSKQENLQLMQKVKAALKKGGRFYILEFFRKAASASDMIGALQSFFFSFSSTSGLWKESEIKSWFQETTFVNIRTHKFAQLPGFGFISGQKG